MMKADTPKFVLVPCPFCGGEVHCSQGADPHIVCLNDCGMLYITMKHSFRDFDKMVKGWNTRAPISASPKPDCVGVEDLPAGQHTIAHDGFTGDVIGHYVTREGKRGVVLQQVGTRVVHVYGEKWLAVKEKAHD